MNEQGVKIPMVKTKHLYYISIPTSSAATKKKRILQKQYGRAIFLSDESLELKFQRKKNNTIILTLVV